MADLGWILIQFCIIFFRFPRSKTVRPVIFVVIALTLPNAALGSRAAYVEVSSSGNSAGKDGDTADPVQVKGEFAGIGAVKNAEGDLHLVPPCDDGEEDDLMMTWGRGWIGTLHVEENLTDQCGGGATLVDRVKKAMLLGASAILILAFNPQLVKELDISQLFTHPVVILKGAENITKVLTALTGGSKVRAKVVHEKAFHEAMGWTAVDSWDSCTLVFPKDWQDRDWWDTAPDVVCKEGTKRLWQTYFTQAWNMVLIFVTTLSVLLMLQVRWRTQDDSYTTEQVETALQRLASDALSRMRVKRYKHFHRRRHDGEKEKDACAVCLDHFYPGQAVRVLPCFHEFHRKCVDSWLIKKRTCPLCTFNILDKQEGSCLLDN
ncbi:PREDICTED: RING finger protein 215-like isoform X2 [Branchiostoma belcheri]|uniref:RING finger protein 215-like isoform X2 n=1 Tax=Branchiostoma belcheri TaxID=7741 RepID=A0A6P4Y1B6_BRABE|nr:PREDICTED: RING finger protein 215-like isoform X2 [Branchiostoma belcheri]